LGVAKDDRQAQGEEIMSTKTLGLTAGGSVKRATSKNNQLSDDQPVSTQGFTKKSIEKRERSSPVKPKESFKKINRRPILDLN